MKKMNFIGGFIMGAFGSIWTLFIFAVGFILGILLDINGSERHAYNSYPRYRK